MSAAGRFSAADAFTFSARTLEATKSGEESEETCPMDSMAGFGFTTLVDSTASAAIADVTTTNVPITAARVERNMSVSLLRTSARAIAAATLGQASRVPITA